MSLFSETSPSSLTSNVGPIVMENEKPMALELAMSSLGELVKMCGACEPLWVINGKEGGRETLDLDEYSRLSPWPNLKNLEMFAELRREASRDSAVVIMNSLDLVDAFLDANKWMKPLIVARAKTIQVIVSGVSSHASGSLHLMYAELQLPSPSVPTRESYFLRYCQQNAEEGSWAVVDFPVDSFLDSLPSPPPVPTYRRRPSGCIIQDMPNGYSRVTWVEHADEFEEKPVHPLFSEVMNSGAAFGAHRWLRVLERQCERVASLMARNISELGVIPSPEARKKLMRLAQRTTRTFCVNISPSRGQCWTALSDCLDDSVRITTRKITEPGQPNGVVLGAISTTCLPYSHHQVFDLLKDERRRSLEASNSSPNVEVMLQENCTDQWGSLVVYSTIDVDSIQLVMSEEDPSSIPRLPIGFIIFPNITAAIATAGMTSTDGKASEEEGRDNTATGGLQVLASAIPTAKVSLSTVSMITGHLYSTLHSSPNSD